MTNRASNALSAWLEKEDRSQSWLARQLVERGVECHQSSVHAWVHGERPPRIEAAVEIQRLTGISVEDWVEEVDALSSTGT